jgi:predicted GNAT family N-acyltransferase
MSTSRKSPKNVTVRQARTEEDMRDVLMLRERVYVADQGRLNSVDDTKETFDKYDQHGTYLVAYGDAGAIGAVKIIRDSDLGLPCESTARLSVDLNQYRAQGGRLVEFGHLVSAPEVRSTGVGMLLMRKGLMFSINELKATHLLGDFFADDEGNFQPFYTLVGFQPICAPYRDVRFAGSPLSVVGMVDVEAGMKLWREGSESQRQMLEYFLGQDQLSASP